MSGHIKPLPELESGTSNRTRRSHGSTS